GKAALGLAVIDAPRRGIAVEDIVASTSPVDMLDGAGTAIALLPLDTFGLRDNAGQVVETGLGTALEFVAGCRSVGRRKTGDYDGDHHHQRQYPGGLQHGESSSFPNEDRHWPGCIPWPPHHVFVMLRAFGSRSADYRASRSAAPPLRNPRAPPSWCGHWRGEGSPHSP